MKKFCLIFLFFLFVNTTFSSQSATIELSTRNFYKDRPFQIQIKLPEEAALDKMPRSSSSFEILYLGMTPYRFTKRTFQNGKWTKVTERSFNYIYQITPLKEGDIKIGSFTFNSGQETYTTEELVVSVGTQPQLNSLQNRKIVKLFMNIYTPKLEVYKNKATVIEARIYSDNREFIEQGFQESAKLFIQKSIVFDVSDSLKDGVIYQTNISGFKFYYRTIKRYIIFPVDTGDIMVQPPVINLITPYSRQLLKEPNFVLSVKDAVPGPGLTYMGDLEVELNYFELPVRLGDYYDFQLLMRGSGNLKILSHPYASVSSTNYFISQPRADVRFDTWKKGKAFFIQTLDYRVSTVKTGEFTIPEISISYLDDKSQKKEIVLDEFTFTVLENVEDSAEKALLPDLSKDDRKIVLLWNNPLFVLVSIFFLFLPLSGFLYGRYNKRLQTDGDFARRQHATKEIDKVLKQAKLSLDRQDWKQFYHLLYTHVLNYIKNKYSLPAGLKLSEVMLELEKTSIKPDKIKQIESVLKKWSGMAYSPLLKGDSAVNDLQLAQEMIKSII